MFAKKKGERTCPKGHVLEKSWQRCPYCEAEKGSTAHEAGDEPAKEAAAPEEEAPVPKRAHIVELHDPSRRAVVVSRPAPERGLPAGWLVALGGEQLGQDFRLDRGRNVLGKGSDCHVVLRDAHASERHAVLEVREGGEAVLEDLDSRHGTRVNGELLRGSRTLADGDLLRVGATELCFRTFEAGPRA